MNSQIDGFKKPGPGENFLCRYCLVIIVIVVIVAAAAGYYFGYHAHNAIIGHH